VREKYSRHLTDIAPHGRSQGSASELSSVFVYSGIASLGPPSI